MVAATQADYDALEACLLNRSGDTPLCDRFRALFTLKSLAAAADDGGGDHAAVRIIAAAFRDDSALLKHELAYVLGQTRNKAAIPYLNDVLADPDEDPMVRHEAAEALGAIGDPKSLRVLERYLTDNAVVVRQTCELAIEKIKFENKGTKEDEVENIPPSIYASVDPAPPSTSTDSTAFLEKTLLDPEVPLFERYRAMFALRNKGDVPAVLALAKGLDDSSALFRHEIAYVFGQMQHPASVPSLVKCLEKDDEEAMVRHECAEALGSIATEEVYAVLRKHATNPIRVVRESCEVALDMADHENSNEFQYADGLERTVCRR